MIEDRQLGEGAMKYLRDTLAKGDRLAHYLLELPLESGKVHAHLPQEIATENIVDFDTDVFWGREFNPADDWNYSLLCFVLTYLAAAPGNVAVWEGWPETLEREPLWSGELNYFWDNDGIWAAWGGAGGTRSESRTPYIYVLSTSDEESIPKAFQHARWYPTVCVLTEHADGPHLPSPPFVADQSLLASLATRSTHILVGAFDECGCVIWTRNRATPLPS